MNPMATKLPLIVLTGKFFSSVFISEDTTSLPSFTLTNSPPDIDISPQSVLEKLKSLKVDKSPGPDHGWPLF